jgi:predicted enzyme related to lactoylglutathione lyase
MAISTDRGTQPARAVGVNHVALEVGDIDAALEFYGQLFDLRLRSRGKSMAFIDLGDQFIALSEGRSQAPDTHRHFGLVVDDIKKVVRAARQAGADILSPSGRDFLDPWGNHIQIVDYAEIQFTKAHPVLKGMGLQSLKKSTSAIEELASKGMAPE